MPHQNEIQTLGYAIQCRITTEDPTNDFMPDSGTIIAYRSSGGFGVRLDAGDGFQGAEISPYYDSLLVKLSTHAVSFKQAEEKMERSLREMRIRGVKRIFHFSSMLCVMINLEVVIILLNLLKKHLNFSILHRHWIEVPRL